MEIKSLKNKKWKKGDATLINRLQWDEKEVQKILEVLESDWFAGNSRFNQEFEKRLSDFSGLKYFQSVNSGSSAIELAVQALMMLGVIKRNDFVLHPALTFSTSISSSVRAGLRPVFVDVEIGTYLIDLNQVEDVLDYYPIKLAIIPLLLGNVPDIKKLKKMFKERDIPIILDSCDTMGSLYDEKEAASYGDFATYSFYGSHHVSTLGTGGAVGTNNEEYYNIVKSLTFWGRDFQKKVSNKMEDFLNRYTYKTYGYNMQMPAIAAAFGIAQLERLDSIISLREKRFREIQNIFMLRNDSFYLPRRTSEVCQPNFFAYPLTMKQSFTNSRERVVSYLTDKNVEIRPIFTYYPGENFAKKYDFMIYRGAPISKYVSENGFFIPLAVHDEENWHEYREILRNIPV